MRKSRILTWLVFAAILPQLTGCVHVVSVPIQSLPQTPETARASDQVRVISRKEGSSYRSSVEVSGAWVDSDTLRAIEQHWLQDEWIAIPIQDIQTIQRSGTRLYPSPKRVLVASTLILGLLYVLNDFDVLWEPPG